MPKNKQYLTNVKNDINRYELRHWTFAVKEAHAQTGRKCFYSIETLASAISVLIGRDIHRESLYYYWSHEIPEDVQDALIELLGEFMPALPQITEMVA